MSQFIKGKIPDRPPRNLSEVLAIVVVSLFFAGMMGADFFKDYSVYKLGIPIFLVSWAVLLVIHEFGHALMARALGWRVEKVCIGTGKLITKKQIFGMPTEFRAIPLSGYAMPRPTDLIQPQMKSFLIFAAGPGIELLLAIGIWIAVGSDMFFSRQPILWLIALQVFSAAAVFGAVMNLVPLPHQNDNGTYAWSDGLGMILSWRLPDEHFAQQITSKSR